jgi:chromosomal replication initiation ATPase DnaA
MAALIQTVERLHEAALTLKRRITVPLAREVLKIDKDQNHAEQIGNNP